MWNFVTSLSNQKRNIILLLWMTEVSLFSFRSSGKRNPWVFVIWCLVKKFIVVSFWKDDIGASSIFLRSDIESVDTIFLCFRKFRKYVWIGLCFDCTEIDMVDFSLWLFESVVDIKFVSCFIVIYFLVVSLRHYKICSLKINIGSAAYIIY